MTFELSPIIGNGFGDYQFKIKHVDSVVMKRVKSEVIELFKKNGYSLDVKRGPLER